DAHRREVFSALYRVAGAKPFEPERLAEIEAAAVGDPVATVARWRRDADHASAIFIGDGATLYAEVIRQAAGPDARIVEAPPPAATIGRVAAARARQGVVMKASAIRPLYVRRPDAEIARARQNS